MFDKTGTLTNGRPEVSRSILYVARTVCSAQLFLTLVGVAESNSEHPLGQAITSFAKKVTVLEVDSNRFNCMRDILLGAW